MNKILRFLIPFTAALSVLVFLFLLADKEARATTPTITLSPATAGNNQQTSSNGDFSKVASYSKLHSVTQTDQSLMVIPPMSESEGGWENQCLDDCIKHNISMTGKNIAIDSNGIPHIAYGADQLYYGWYDGLDWNIQVIDATPGAGAGASLVLDHNNYPHIAYNSPSGILYAYQDASGWHTEWVTNAYYNPSLALDQNDNPHISCYQSPNLYYGYKDQTGWHFEVINTQAYENYWLTLDQDGNPHLAASRRRNNLIYIFRDLNGWHTELIDEWNRNFGSPSIAIDSTRLPHIVYNIGQGINYAFKDADGWHIEGVSGGYLSQISLVLDILDRPHFVTTHDFQYCAGSYFFRDELGWHGLPMTDNVCGYPSIFLDTNNIPHVLYPNNNGSLIYEKHEETGWKKTVVDSGLLTGKFNSIEIDSNFYLHASTYEDFYNDLRYIYQDSLGTHAELIDAEGSVGKYSSLALDTSSYPHISYYNESNGDLKYAYQDPSGWHIQTLESAGDIGLYTSLELNEYGYAHISYYDQTNMDLKFAYQDSSGWHIQTIDSAGDVGLYSSLVMDSLGNPHFSYYDATNHTLKYDGQIIDNEGEVGKYSSLSLDINDRPHISYYDETQGDLKYLFFDDLGWHTEIVDSSGDVGQFSSLALHGGTEPYISYSDTTKKDLKFAFRTSHGWETRTIDYLGNVGSHTSIQLDEGGYPWIVYSDEDNFDIKFARYWFDLPPDGWRVEVVDSELLVGSHSSIAMDEQDGIHISYYDEMTPSLKYAQFDGLNWNIQTVDSFGQDTSIALDEDGYAHIASDDGGVVKYAFQDPTGWHTQTVGTGNNISLALGTSGSAQMSIVSNTTSYTGTLYYAFQDDSSWLTQTIAVGRPFGDTSIALDYQGDPHISYIQYSCRWFCWEYGCFWVCDQGGLNYTYRDGSNWNILPLETGVSVGPHISSSLDQEEYPHISFQGNGNLMYIYQDSTGWYTETVDSSPGVGDYSSLVLDGAGQPYISYYDSTNANLKFAFRDEQGWHVQTIDSALTVGTYTSLALDKFGFPHISYDNATNGDLKHAYFAPKFITPLFQGGFGTPGSTVTYTLDIHNLASQMETYSIDVGQNDWNSSLSDELVGPLPPYNSQTITLSVSIPQDTPWYLTDTVVITAASVSNPMINFSTARVTTQAFALPQINVSPLSMETNQAVGQTTTQTLTISNGNGVTLTFNIYYEITGSVLNMHLNEPDGSTKFHDSSGNLNEGTCIGATCPTSGLPGKHGTALFFDGTDDLISVANDQSLNPQNAMAISAWIYAEDWNGNKRILQKGMWDNQYRLMAEDGALHFDIYTIGRVTADLPSTGAWHHVVGVFDGNQMQLWVDGELKAEQAAIGMIPSTTDPVYLGTKCLGCWVYDYFYGKIDEVMVFNRALNSWEIQALYAGWLTDKYYWLDVKPDTGGVPENSALPILVSFDAIGAQPDTYTTTLFLMNNDPIQPMVRVPVTMTVEPSPTMGWVEGLITDMRTGEPMEATIIAQGQPFTVTSAADTGKYLLWLEPGSYTLEVSAAGYIPQTGQVEINTNMGSLQDFGVLRDAAWMQYIPEKFEITVGVNQLLTQTLKLTNSGSEDLDFFLEEGSTGPIVQLHLDESSGATTFQDSSYYKHNGSCSGDTCPIADVAGRFGTAVSFDGYNDYIQITPYSMGGPISIGAWVYSRDITANSARVIDFSNGSFSDNIIVAWSGTSGKMHWGVSRGSDWQYIETELVFPQNEWVHVTTVVDETDTGYFYWNGNLVASGPMHTPMQTLRNLQYIARPAIDWWQYFNGVIDEFVVYTHALSQEEVMELVAGELDSDVPWLSIDPISGTVPANDSINVQVTFDTTDLLPDIYTTTLFLSSNDPLIPLAEIPITMTVTREVTPTSVIIDGVEQGWLGREYAFTATVSPETAGTPITYTWQADGQAPVTHSGGITDTISYTWDSPGTKIITLTASNAYGEVMDNHQISILEMPYHYYLPLIQKGEPARGSSGFGGMEFSWLPAGTIGILPLIPFYILRKRRG